MTLTYDQLVSSIDAVGMSARGGFQLQPSDTLTQVDGCPVRSLILIGLTGTRHWPTFRNSPEYGDGLADPLDRWSTRLIDSLAARFGGRALYPFGRPPWWPFQRWARRALQPHTSPLGVLIDPKFGMWHSYRGALALQEEVQFPAAVLWPNPCESCEAKPCLSTCPVGAVKAGAYDADSCRRYVRSNEGGCRSLGCLARRACPVGMDYAYPPEQAGFYMEAFARAGVADANASGPAIV